jgi:phosphate transport system protein
MPSPRAMRCSPRRWCSATDGGRHFYNSIFRTLVTYMVENPKTITECAHLLFIAKNIERIGDHATNVAEMVYYAATGQYLPERDRTTIIES